MLEAIVPAPEDEAELAELIRVSAAAVCHFRSTADQIAFVRKRNSGTGRDGLEPLLMERTSVIVDRMKHRSPAESFAQNQVEYFVAHGLMATVLRWHWFGFPSSPEEMAAVFGQILRSEDLSVARLLL